MHASLAISPKGHDAFDVDLRPWRPPALRINSSRGLLFVRFPKGLVLFVLNHCLLCCDMHRSHMAQMSAPPPPNPSDGLCDPFMAIISPSSPAFVPMPLSPFLRLVATPAKVSSNPLCFAFLILFLLVPPFYCFLILKLPNTENGI